MSETQHKKPARGSEPRGGESPEHISFLSSLLVRFPEIGSAQLLDGGRTLSLEFYLNRRLGSAEFRRFADEVRTSQEVFLSLVRLKPADFRLERQRPARARRGERLEGLDSFQAVRDLGTLTVEEISLLVALVREHFGEDLVRGEELFEEDEDLQEEMIHESLEKIRNFSQEVNLIGFRDDMRVLIYSSGESKSTE
jgi:hypothetical protein